MKALGLVVSDKTIFENCILKHISWPRDLLMQPTRTVGTTLVEEHIGIIPVKFGQNPMSSFRGEVVKRNYWLTNGRTDARTDDGQWAIAKAHIEHFVLRWAKKTYFKYPTARCKFDSCGLHLTVAGPVWNIYFLFFNGYLNNVTIKQNSSF